MHTPSLLQRLLTFPICAASLSLSADAARADWQPSITDVMGLVHCLVGAADCQGLQPGRDVADVVTCGEGTTLNDSGSHCVLPGDEAQDMGPPSIGAGPWAPSVSDVMDMVYCVVGLSDCEGLQPGLDTLLFVACAPGTLLDDATMSCAAAMNPEPDPTEAYYGTDHVLSVAVEMNPEDWDTLRHQSRTLADVLGGDCLDGPTDDVFSWFSGTVTVDGVTVPDVGLRKKGFLGSLSTTQPSLKIRFNKWVNGQRLDGALKRLTLNNVQHDDSMLNTCLAYEVFAGAGIPAPRCGFATVSVNGESLGLYVHVESVKSAFLARHFEDINGNLYEGTMSDFRPVWEGRFEKKTNRGQADFSDIHAVTEALEDPTPAGLVALQEFVDVDQFLTYWAVEVLTGHWDSYSGNRSNFFIYREPAGPFTFIPWGPDGTFEPVGQMLEEADLPQSVMAHGAIAHRLYQDDDARAAYVDRLQLLLDTVWDESALTASAQAMAALIHPHLPSEEAQAAAGLGLARVLDFIANRRAALTAELESGPAAWDWPLQAPDICWQVLGEVDMAFATTWGSSGATDITQTGTLDVAEYTVDGQVVSGLGSGASAGLSSHGEDGTMATLSLVHLLPGGGLDVINLFLNTALMHPDVVPLDTWQDDIAGYRITAPVAGGDTEVTAHLRNGAVVFDEASLIPGAPVSGYVYGTLYGLGGYVSGNQAQEAAAAATGALVINEVSPRGAPLDWFEIYNATEGPLDLTGFVFADDLDDADKRTPFPAGTTLPAGAYLQVTLDTHGWPGFALGSHEELAIWTAEGVLVDAVDWAEGAAGAGQSYARVPDVAGGFETVTSPTPGTSNP